MSGGAPALAHRVERLFRRASPAFRAEVVAPFLADWRYEAAVARRDGTGAGLRLTLVYLARLPALGLAALAERSRPMSDLRLSQLVSRAFYLAAIAPLFAVPRCVAGAESPIALVTVLVALLGLGLALVAAGLLIEMRERLAGA